MTDVANGFEGGTSGTTITQGSGGNSGGASGGHFDVVGIGTGAALTFDSTHAAHGSLAAKMATGSPAANSYLEWSTSLSGSAITQAWFRVYCYFTAFTGTVRIVRALNGSSFIAAVAINSSGKVLTQDTSGTTRTTSTLTLPVNQWFRLEGFFTGSATAGQVEVKIFTTSADATSPDETDTTAATLNTTGTFTGITFGNPSSVASYTFWLDDLGASVAAYLGPSVASAALAETGSSADTLAAAAAVAVAESGSAADAAAVAASASLAEAGASADALGVAGAVSLADAATGAEALGVAAAASLIETGTAADAVTAGGAAAMGESGSAADSLSVSAALSLADGAAGADILAVTVPVGLADLAAAAETAGIAAMARLVEDGGTSSEALAVTGAPALADSGSAADTLAAMLLQVKGTGIATVADVAAGRASATARGTGPSLITAGSAGVPAVSGEDTGTATVTQPRRSVATVT